MASRSESRRPEEKPPVEKIGVISSGRGENLRYIIEAACCGYIPARIVIVIADSSEAGALRIAHEYGIKAIFLDPAGLDRVEFDRLMQRQLEEADVGLVVLSGYMRILSHPFVNRFKNRILNIHPALLPAFPGLDAFQQALDYGVRWTGTTVHLVDEEVDHGPIIYQQPVPVEEGDTKESLKARIQQAEFKAYPEAIKRFLEDRPRIKGRRVVFEEV